MTFFLWSQTAATNNTIDSTVNWREGQAPSTVNNSARAMMAALAKYRDDIGSTLTTGGSSTAYTATTSQGLTSLVNGTVLRVRLHAASGASPSFSPDSLTAKAITTDGSTVLPTGAGVLGGIYDLTYRSSVDKWIISGYYGDSYNATTAPDLTAIEALSSTGILRRTGSNTWALVSDLGTLAITSTANRLVGTDGSGNVGVATATAPITYGSNTVAVSSASTAAVGVVQLADAAAMEAITAGRAVTADVQDRHPRHPKAFLNYNQSTDTTNRSSGISSKSSDGTGLFTASYSTAFSAADYALYGMCQNIGSTAIVMHQQAAGTYSTTASQFSTRTGSSGTTVTSSYNEIMALGDQ